MVSKDVFDKANRMIVTKFIDTEKSYWLKLASYDKYGNFRGELDEKVPKPVPTKIDDILKIVDMCPCFGCSSFKMNKKELCSYQICVIKELVKKGLLGREFYETIRESVI
jgi:hypothetical protein